MFRRGLFYSYLSIYLRFFLGLSVTETTLFASLPMICNVVFQNFVWGNISDKYQLRRTLIIIGEITAAVITIAVWYIHTLTDNNSTAGYIIIIGLSIVEIFWSMSNVGWSALLSDLYPAEERAGIQGKLQSFGSLGRFGGVLIGGLLYDGIPYIYPGWGFHEGALFMIASGVMAISTIPIFFLPEGGVAVSNNTTGAAGLKELITGAGSKFAVSRKFAVFLIAMTFIYFGMNSVSLLKSQYLTLEDGFNVSSRLLSYILNMATIAVFLVGMTVRRLSLRFKDEYLLLFGTFVTAIYLLGYVFSRILPLIFVSDFLFGTSFSIIVASSYAYASRLIPPEKRGKQFAMFNATMFLSWGLPGTFLTGPLVDFLINSGFGDVFSYRMAFLAAAGMVLIGSIILIVNIRSDNKNRLPVRKPA